MLVAENVSLDSIGYRPGLGQTPLQIREAEIAYHQAVALEAKLGDSKDFTNETLRSLERIILASPEWSARWAKHMKERYKHYVSKNTVVWDYLDEEDAEEMLDTLKSHVAPVVAKHPVWANYYARGVLGKRFPAGEGAILKNPKETMLYVRHIIQGPWARAEPVISSGGGDLWKEYVDYIKNPDLQRPSSVAKTSYFLIAGVALVGLWLVFGRMGSPPPSEN